MKSTTKLQLHTFSEDIQKEDEKEESTKFTLMRITNEGLKK